MIKTNNGIKIHNRFEAQLIDAATGVCKQTAVAENVVLDTWSKSMLYAESNRTSYLISTLVLGTGSGTPSAADTGLFNKWTDIRFPSALGEEIVDKNTAKIMKRWTIEASPSYVADITEVGLGVADIAALYGGTLISHAMFKDSEGHDIIIHKTDLDILVITVTIYVSIDSKDPDFILLPIEKTSLYNFFKASSDAESTIPLWKYAYFGGGLVTLENTDREQYFRPDYSYNQITIFDNGYKVTLSRMDRNTNNYGFINNVYWDGLGGYNFPNPKIMPNIRLNGLEIGVGDGEKQDFDCPIEMFVKNTDIVYKNGVPLTRDVDYTIDNYQNVTNMKQIFTSNFCNIISEKQGTTDNHGNQHSAWKTGSIKETVSGAVAKYRSNEIFGSQRPWYKYDQELILEFSHEDSLIGNSIDAIYLNDFHLGSAYFLFDSNGNKYQSSSSGLLGTLVFDFYTSDDGVTFDLVDEFSFNNSIEGQADNLRLYTGWIPLKQKYNKRYIKIKFNEEKSSVTAAQDTFCYQGQIYLGHKGNPIHFITAPESGSVLTMDAEIDRPYKTNKMVMDISYQMTFS